MTFRSLAQVVTALVLAMLGAACGGSDDGNKEERGSTQEALESPSCIPTQCFADCMAPCGNDICGGGAAYVCALRCGCSIGYAEVAEAQ